MTVIIIVLKNFVTHHQGKINTSDHSFSLGYVSFLKKDYSIRHLSFTSNNFISYQYVILKVTQ